MRLGVIVVPTRICSVRQFYIQDLTQAANMMSTLIRTIKISGALALISGITILSPAIAAESETVFVRLIAALDEPRGLCLDIPGHRDRVNVKRPLVLHTCKWSIWNNDERFDRPALSRGELRMGAYNLCLGADNLRDGGKLVLGDCAATGANRWNFSDHRISPAGQPGLCITAGAEPSKLTPGGQRLPSRHVARSVGLASCTSESADRQRWRLADPAKP